MNTIVSWSVYTDYGKPKMNITCIKYLLSNGFAYASFPKLHVNIQSLCLN